MCVCVRVYHPQNVYIHTPSPEVNIPVHIRKLSFIELCWRQIYFLSNVMKQLRELTPTVAKITSLQERLCHTLLSWNSCFHIQNQSVCSFFFFFFLSKARFHSGTRDRPWFLFFTHFSAALRSSKNVCDFANNTRFLFFLKEIGKLDNQITGVMARAWRDCAGLINLGSSRWFPVWRHESLHLRERQER